LCFFNPGIAAIAQTGTGSLPVINLSVICRMRNQEDARGATGAAKMALKGTVSDSGAPEMDFVVTVCDNAAGEACPFWPGHPVTAHWGFPDQAAVEGTDEQKRAALAQTLRQMRHRVQLFMSLALETLDRMAIENRMRAIGREAL
jgi:hypothetical protein